MEMQTLDVEIAKFKVFIEKFSKMFEHGHLSSNMFKSQMTQLRMAQTDLEEKNKKAEEQLNTTVSVTEKIKAEGDAYKEQRIAEGTVLYAKAHAKYKEFERHLEEADRKRLKAELKELEAVA